jgi:hypothetical protein
MLGVSSGVSKAARAFFQQSVFGFVQIMSQEALTKQDNGAFNL